MITFAKIVESGSISAASLLMGIDKGAISRQLRDLEDQLGVKLLHRTTRQQVLTEAGHVVFERAQRVVHEVEHACTEAETFHSHPSGVLTISASVAFGKLHVIPLVDEFVALYPDLDLQLCLLDRQVDPIDEGIDVLLRLCDAPPQNLAARRLCDIKYAIVESADVASRSAVNVPSDLINRDCLFYGFKSRQSTWHFRLEDVEEAVQVTTRVSVNSSEAVRELALRGLGAALLPEFAIANDIRSGKLVQLLAAYEVQGSLGNSLYAIHLAGRSYTPKVRVFVEFLQARWGSESGVPWAL